jgi:hypothetical protein
LMVAVELTALLWWRRADDDHQNEGGGINHGDLFSWPARPLGVLARVRAMRGNLKECLVPKLKRGDVVMMDSLPVHRVAAVRAFTLDHFVRCLGKTHGRGGRLPCAHEGGGCPWRISLPMKMMPFSKNLVSRSRPRKKRAARRARSASLPGFATKSCPFLPFAAVFCG